MDRLLIVPTDFSKEAYLDLYCDARRSAFSIFVASVFQGCRIDPLSFEKLSIFVNFWMKKMIDESVINRRVRLHEFAEYDVE